MAEMQLVQPDDAVARPARRTSWLPIAIVAIALALLAAGAGWWFLSARETIPDWERLAALSLSAPTGDAFQGETPWVNLQLSPGRPGEENTVRVSLEAPRGAPISSSASSPRIVAITAWSLAGESAPPETLALEPDPATDGAFLATSSLDRAGWWRIAVEVEGAPRPAEFHLLLPDPNLNGPNAVPDVGTSVEGEALFQRGLEGITGLSSVQFTQWIADGKGNAAVSEHAVTTGGEGGSPGFTYRAVGGMEAVIIGSTRWIKMSGDADWQEQEGASVVPPAEWGEEYRGATGFTMLGEETIDGERSLLLAFVAPELSEPRRRTVAWYLWWVGADTGHVRKEAMVSRVHYMLNQFGDFDAPLIITPPDGTGTPAAGTPPPLGTPTA